MDLTVGDQYRIANELPNGKILWISGVFEAIERPRLLIYTWIVEAASPTTERVSVKFKEHERGTEIILNHKLISTNSLRDQHEQGWFGCLNDLVKHLTD